jgi:hypothetical protein
MFAMAAATDHLVTKRSAFAMAGSVATHRCRVS